MGKAKRSSRRAVKGPVASTPAAADFDTVVGLIDAARRRAFQAVNTALIDLYWAIGEHISSRVSSAGWGQGTVRELAEYIYRRVPNARGFSAQNLWRMKQFFETYRGLPKLSALLRELPWTHRLPGPGGRVPGPAAGQAAPPGQAPGVPPAGPEDGRDTGDRGPEPGGRRAEGQEAAGQVTRPPVARQPYTLIKIRFRYIHNSTSQNTTITSPPRTADS